MQRVGTVEASTPWEPAGGGEMGDLIRSHDWAATPLGPLETWPQSIRTVVQLMLDMPQPACLWWGTEPRLLYNNEYQTILDGKESDALGRTMDEVWPELVNTVQHPLDTVRAHGAQRLVDREFVLGPEGERTSRWFTSTWTPIHDDSGAVIGAFNVSTETTDRVLAERALREKSQSARDELERHVGERTRDLASALEAVRRNEQRLRLLLEQMPAMLWTTDRQLRVTALLGAAVPAFDGGALSASDQNVTDVFDGTVSAGAVAALHRRALSGAPAEFEFQVDDQTFEGYVEALRDASGQTVGTIGVAHDVSERTLRKLQEDFIDSVSHDLQTPLTSIRAGLGLLEAGAGDKLGPAERELLAASRRNAERLRLQISQLLAANRMMAGGDMRADRIEIDLHEVVTDAVEAIRPVAQQKQQVVQVDLPRPLVVEGDRRLLDQVLTNLLTNAHRHTPPGTWITVSAWLVGDDIRLAVHDTGPGIPADELDASFERFHRSAARGLEGSGLGLAIARSAVEAHGGRIWAESVPGEGATFTVSLPRTRPA